MIGSDGPGDKLFRLVYPRGTPGTVPLPRPPTSGSSLSSRGVGSGYHPQVSMSYSAGDRRSGSNDISRFVPYGMTTGVAGIGGAPLKSNLSEERYLTSRYNDDVRI